MRTYIHANIHRPTFIIKPSVSNAYGFVLVGRKYDRKNGIRNVSLVMWRQNVVVVVNLHKLNSNLATHLTKNAHGGRNEQTVSVSLNGNSPRAQISWQRPWPWAKNTSDSPATATRKRRAIRSRVNAAVGAEPAAEAAAAHTVDGSALFVFMPRRDRATLAVEIAR